jgi:hypothetical protein
MNGNALRLGAALALAAGLVAASPGQIGWTMRGFNTTRSGNNQYEKVLNQNNVNTGQFGLIFTRQVDGQIYAQPLVVPKVAIPGKGTFDVVYVATEHDSVFAFDADNPQNTAPLWQRSFIDPAKNITTIPYYYLTGEMDMHPEVGITGTPAIDVVGGTMYVVVRTLEGDPSVDANYIQRLWALDLATGAPKFGGPVVLSASVPGTGDGSSGGIVPFNGRRENQRPALVLNNGTVYIATASHGDQTPYHGWVLAYDAKTLAQKAFFCSTPNGYDGGIWMSGQGMPVDASGNLFAATGNGHFNPAQLDYGDSVLKLNGSTLALEDYFTPYNQSSLDQSDLDLGVTGPILLPGYGFLVQGSKEGKLYVVPTNGMGKFNAAGDNQIPQWWWACSALICAPPVVWQGGTNGYNLYVWSSYDVLKGFTFNGRTFNTTPFANSSSGASFPGGMLTLSSDGEVASSAIVWATTTANGGSANQTTQPGTLHAFNASTLAELWNSSMVAGDDYGNFAKFNPPVVVNGKVYVPTFSNQLAVYGLLPAAPPPAVGLNAQAGDTEVGLTWQSTHGVANYVVSRGKVGGPYTPIATVPGSTAFYDDTNLTNGQTYAYRVVATNAHGSSLQSNEATAEPVHATIPTTHPGLVGSYFNDPSNEATQFTTLGLKRVDQTIDFNWNGASPGGDIGGQWWSAIWTGTLIPPTTGLYTFQTVSDDGSRLWVGGAELTNGWVEQAPTSYYSAPILLMAGKPYPIQVEYFQGPGGSAMQLYWAPPGSDGNYVIVPSTSLMTYPGETPGYDASLDMTANFTLDGMSYLDEPRSGDIGYFLQSFAAELLPRLSGFDMSPGIPFLLGAGYPGALNIVECDGQTITVPVYQAKTAYFLGCAINGTQSGTFTFNFSDGTMSTQSLSFTDWSASTAQNGELRAAQYKFRHNAQGDLPAKTSIFRYAVPLDSTKRLISITLPSNSDMKILGLSVVR